jgi:ankyrin repeat protein
MQVRLLEHGGMSVINAQNYRGETLLHIAASCDLPECCELLLRAGSQASLIVRISEGYTPS